MRRTSRVLSLFRPFGLAFALGVALSSLGCATSPPVDKEGFPRVSRYATSAQLEWMLRSYVRIAKEAFDKGQGERVEQACLLWERTVFDMRSFVKYPVILRLSTEGLALDEMRADAPTIASRYPLPEVCKGSPAQSTAQASPAPVDVGQVAQAQGTELTEGAQKAQPTPVPVQPLAAASVNQSAVARERAQLRALAAALGDGAERPMVVEQGLADLARSEFPAIRVRAIFHQLGRCTTLADQEDRLLRSSGTCEGGGAMEPYHRGERRLQAELLRAASKTPRGKSEPLSDLILALSAYTSRDNPAIDGPRPALR